MDEAGGQSQGLGIKLREVAGVNKHPPTPKTGSRLGRQCACQSSPSPAPPPRITPPPSPVSPPTLAAARNRCTVPPPVDLAPQGRGVNAPSARPARWWTRVQWRSARGVWGAARRCLSNRCCCSYHCRCRCRYNCRCSRRRGVAGRGRLRLSVVRWGAVVAPRRPLWSAPPRRRRRRLRHHGVCPLPTSAVAVCVVRAIPPPPPFPPSYPPPLRPRCHPWSFSATAAPWLAAAAGEGPPPPPS